MSTAVKSGSVAMVPVAVPAGGQIRVPLSVNAPVTESTDPAERVGRHLDDEGRAALGEFQRPPM
jgi:hypothetical protein